MSAIRAFEVGQNIVAIVQAAVRVSHYLCSHKHAGSILPPGASPLKQCIQKNENACRHDALQQPRPEMGKCECFFNCEACVLQPIADRPRMKIKIELSELDRFQREGAPLLPAEPI